MSVLTLLLSHTKPIDYSATKERATDEQFKLSSTAVAVAAVAAVVVAVVVVAVIVVVVVGGVVGVVGMVGVVGAVVVGERQLQIVSIRLLIYL